MERPPENLVAPKEPAKEVSRLRKCHCTTQNLLMMKGNGCEGASCSEGWNTRGGYGVRRDPMDS